MLSTTTTDEQNIHLPSHRPNVIIFIGLSWQSRGFSASMLVPGYKFSINAHKSIAHLPMSSCDICLPGRSLFAAMVEDQC
jgi:hypothetical protein